MAAHQLSAHCMYAVISNYIPYTITFVILSPGPLNVCKAAIILF